VEPHPRLDEAAPAALGWPSSPTDAQVPERRELTATDAAQAVSVSALPQAEQHLGHALRRV
jgi:hypothetical protein